MSHTPDTLLDQWRADCPKEGFIEVSDTYKWRFDHVPTPEEMNHPRNTAVPIFAEVDGSVEITQQYRDAKYEMRLFYNPASKEMMGVVVVL
jgi:hypothetical protein